MRVTYLIFGIIIMGLVISGIGIGISDLTKEYDTSYNESSVQVYNKLDQTQELADQVSEKVRNTESNTGVVDLLGQFVGRAVDSLKLTFSALSSSQEMVGQASKDIGLPTQFRTALSVMLVIFLLFGVIVSAMVKKDI